MRQRLAPRTNPLPRGVVVTGCIDPAGVFLATVDPNLLWRENIRVDSACSLAFDLYCNNLVVGEGVTLHTKGRRIFVQNRLTLEPSATIANP